MNMKKYWQARDAMEKACDVDSVTMLDEAIATCDPREVQDLHYNIPRTAVEKNAIAILHKLVERGVSVIPRNTSDPKGASKETLEFLLAHGWDINMRSQKVPNNPEPFMWHVVDDIEMVKWCLEHGASVHLRDHVPLGDSIYITGDQRATSQVLERVATSGTVETFELLRSKGAPLGWRSLHLAVEAATASIVGQACRAEREKVKPLIDTKGLEEKTLGRIAAGTVEDEKVVGIPVNEKGPDEKTLRLIAEKAAGDKRYTERMNMVRHLIDVVGCDVNAPDQPVGTKTFGGRWGTPICYILAVASDTCDTQEISWLLLDRGADPTPALRMIANGPPTNPPGPPKLVDEVSAWKSQHGWGSKCCVQ